MQVIFECVVANWETMLSPDVFEVLTANLIPPWNGSVSYLNLPTFLLITPCL